MTWAPTRSPTPRPSSEGSLEPYNGALIAVSPNTKDVVVVSGKDVADRVNDRVAQLGASAAITSIRQGNLIDGLVAALHVMATAAAGS